MFKILRANKPRKCRWGCEIPKKGLYAQYKSFTYCGRRFWISESLCLDHAFDQMCWTNAHCLGFRLEATRANFEQLKKHEKHAVFLKDAKEVKPGVYIVGGVEFGGSTYHHVSIHDYLGRKEREADRDG